MEICTSKILLASGLKDLILYKLSHIHSNKKIYTEAYSNGREQGFTITAFPDFTKVPVSETLQITISEFRNTDQIVVYKNNRALQGLDENSYQNKELFVPNDYNAVIKYCVDYLSD